MKVIKPTRLHVGDTVGIVAPSAPITTDLYPQRDRGIEALESFGLKVKFSPHCFDQHYYSAGTREARIEDFNFMWSDPDVKIVLMAQGGHTANHLLDGIDYNMVKRTPKIFSGISDGTTLLNAIHAKTGLVTYHGPDFLWTFGRSLTEPFLDNFLKTWFDGAVGELRPNPHWKHQENSEFTYSGWRCVRPGVARGTLVGGHVRVLNSTLLAEYGPDFEGTILFLEGTDEVSLLDCEITALKLHGVFNKIAGLIIGWFEGHNAEDAPCNRDVADIVLEATREFSFPILEIGELGHNVENYILPIGCTATLDATSTRLTVDEPTVE